MSDVLTFVFPMPDKVLYANGRAHWAVKSKEKNRLWGMCDLLVAGKVLPPPPKKPWQKASIRSRMTVGALHDTDNAYNRHKPLLDWLVKRRYIVDDKKKCLVWLEEPEQRVSRKNTPQVEITLERLDV